MTETMGGTVLDGRIVPDAPLPEGARVEIRVLGPEFDMPPELRDELRAWQCAGADAIELVERLAEQGGGGETR